MTSPFDSDRKATLICDLQFGSTGKGLIAGYLAERDRPDTVVTAWSANAGHTYIDARGRRFVHCMLANGIVSPNLRRVLIGPGSQISLSRLRAELVECADLLQRAEVMVHQNACVIQDKHVEQEQGSMLAIGSTRKGVGAALIDKISRQPGNTVVAFDWRMNFQSMSTDTGVDIRVVDHGEYLHALEDAERIQVEGAQGYSLGINSGFYPYVTSRECTPAQIASDCLVPLSMIGRVVGTMRTFPIRVANRYDSSGNMVGWSGPMYPDQTETSFKELGQPTELTTVTKLPRRIFTFSAIQTEQAMFACRPDEVFLNFVNYASSADRDWILGTISRAARRAACGGVKYMGYGPTARDVYEGE